MKYTLDTLDKFVLWRLAQLLEPESIWNYSWQWWNQFSLWIRQKHDFFVSSTWFFGTLFIWFHEFLKLHEELQALLRNSFGEFPFKNYIFENVDALIWCLVHNILLWTNRFWLLSGVTVCTLMSVIPYALQFWPWSYYKINSTI